MNLLDGRANPLLADAEIKTTSLGANSADAREIVLMLKPSFCRSLEAAPYEHETPTFDDGAPDVLQHFGIGRGNGCHRAWELLIVGIPNLTQNRGFKTERIYWPVVTGARVVLPMLLPLPLPMRSLFDVRTAVF